MLDRDIPPMTDAELIAQIDLEAAERELDDERGHLLPKRQAVVACAAEIAEAEHDIRDEEPDWMLPKQAKQAKAPVGFYRDRVTCALTPDGWPGPVVTPKRAASPTNRAPVAAPIGFYFDRVTGDLVPDGWPGPAPKPKGQATMVPTLMGSLQIEAEEEEAAMRAHRARDAEHCREYAQQLRRRAENERLAPYEKDSALEEAAKWLRWAEEAEGTRPRRRIRPLNEGQFDEQKRISAELAAKEEEVEADGRPLGPVGGVVRRPREPWKIPD